MIFSVIVENIKCGGCASQVTRKLMSIDGVTLVNVDVDEAQVSGEMTTNVLEKIKITLAGLGYPEVGTQAGLEALGSKAKSFISCAVGKINK